MIEMELKLLKQFLIGSVCLLSFYSFAEEAPQRVNFNASVSNFKKAGALEEIVSPSSENTASRSEASKYNLGDGCTDSFQLGFLGAFVEYANFRPDINPGHSNFNRMSSYGLGVAPIAMNSSWLESIAIEGVAFYFMPKLGVGANHYYSNSNDKYSVVEMVSLGGEFGILFFDFLKLGIGAQAQCVDCYFKNEVDKNGEESWGVRGGSEVAVQYGYGLTVGVVIP